MSSLLIEDIDETTLVQLRRRADRHGRSAEEEARRIIADEVAVRPETALPPPLSEEEKAQRIRQVLALGRKPDERVDFRRLRDELWDYME